MKEVWKPVVGYEGLYEVSNFGRIKSLRGSKERILKTRKARGGYLIVRIRLNSKCKGYVVHRMVAKAFIPNPKNKKQVNHIDGDKTNNKLENLEWCTQQENMDHAKKLGLILKGEKHGRAKLTRKQVEEIREKYVPWIYGFQRLAKEYGILSINIRKIISGERWK